MAVPKKRTSRSKRNMRRSHHALTRTYANICPKCAEPVLPHRACGGCGTYRGKVVSAEKTAA
ncbi:MAG: 50S ribosomal protein L32 [Proteobacteria bacterium]|nr:50S ribosomal protein L32 [Pseudomonadota bacterium]